MTERDPVQRALDGAMLTHDAHQAGQLDGLRDALSELENLADDLRRRIAEIESNRAAGFFEDRK